MHSLEVIILRNARAAGREQAHADLDEEGNTLSTLEHALVECLATPLADSSPVVAAYLTGYVEGQWDDEIAEGPQ